LGGSLLKNAHLPMCLAHIAGSQTPTLVVAGGGAFADQVRLAQQRWQFDDVAAHHMAILAMQQMALLMNALQPEWVLLSSLADMRAWQSQNRVALWFPDITLLNQQAIPASWTVTSDSLAAWLAGILGATDLMIVKAAAVSVTASTAQLVAQGVLDQAFLSYSQHARYTVTVMNSHDFIDKALR
jgi:aspartokinase-like uncharacterized kinase